MLISLCFSMYSNKHSINVHLVICVDPAGAAASQASKEEVDSRSVFVGNVSFMI